MSKRGFGEHFNAYSSMKDFQILEDYKRKIIESKPYFDILIKYGKKFKAPALLEIGCGTGRGSCFASLKFPRGSAVGIDLLKESISASYKTAKLLKCKNNVEFVKCSAEKLPFKKESFQLVFSQGTFEHFKDINKVMREQLRVLSKDGYLVVNVPQTYSYYTLKKQFRMLTGRWDGIWETQYSAGDFKRIAEVYNLKIVETTGQTYDSKLTELVKGYRLLSKLPGYPKALDKAMHAWWGKVLKKHGHMFLEEIIIVLKKK